MFAPKSYMQIKISIFIHLRELNLNFFAFFFDFKHIFHMRVFNEEITDSIQECLQGNTRSFDHLIRIFQNKIFRLCLGFLKETEDAKDATVDVFIKAFRALHSYDARFQFSTWLFRIAINHSLGILREKKRKKKILESELIPLEEQTKHPSPLDIFIKENQKKVIGIAMERIPPRYQLALLLRYQQNLSYREIGAILDIAPSSVGGLLLRGRKMLRQTILQMEEIP
jgi:RNA polymerase sigma-70 factor (ECF subfamily)